MAEDVQRLSRLLEAYDDVSVEAFCEHAAAVLAEMPPTAAVCPPGKNTGTVGNRVQSEQAKKRVSSAGGSAEAHIERYAERLERQLSNPVAFQAVLSELETDKAVRMQQLNAIANHITGGRTRYSSRARALKAIREMQRQHQLSQTRRAQVRDIF